MATLRDVARRAGVSYQTVSRTLNTPDLVLPSTRHRVELAVKEEGYHPNAAARQLRLGRGRFLAIAALCLGGHVAQLIEQLTKAAQARGWTVILALAGDDDPAPGILESVLRNGVRALVILDGMEELLGAAERLGPGITVLRLRSSAPQPHYDATWAEQTMRRFDERPSPG